MRIGHIVFLFGGMVELVLLPPENCLGKKVQGHWVAFGWGIVILATPNHDNLFLGLLEYGVVE